MKLMIFLACILQGINLMAMDDKDILTQRLLSGAMDQEPEIVQEFPEPELVDFMPKADLEPEEAQDVLKTTRPLSKVEQYIANKMEVDRNQKLLDAIRGTTDKGRKDLASSMVSRPIELPEKEEIEKPQEEKKTETKKEKPKVEKNDYFKYANNVDVNEIDLKPVENILKKLGHKPGTIKISSGKRTEQRTSELADKFIDKYISVKPENKKQKDALRELALRGKSPDNILYPRNAWYSNAEKKAKEAFPKKYKKVLKDLVNLRKDFGGYESGHLKGNKIDIPYSSFIDVYGKSKGKKEAEKFVKELDKAGLLGKDEKKNRLSRYGVIDITNLKSRKPQGDAKMAIKEDIDGQFNDELSQEELDRRANLATAQMAEPFMPEGMAEENTQALTPSPLLTDRELASNQAAEADELEKQTQEKMAEAQRRYLQEQAFQKADPSYDIPVDVQQEQLLNTQMPEKELSPQEMLEAAQNERDQLRRNALMLKAFQTIAQAGAMRANPNYRADTAIADTIYKSAGDPVQDFLKMQKLKAEIVGDKAQLKRLEQQERRLAQGEKRLNLIEEKEGRLTKKDQFKVQQKGQDDARAALKDLRATDTFKGAEKTIAEVPTLKNLLSDAYNKGGQSLAMLGPKVARSIAGEVGVLTEQDVVRYVKNPELVGGMVDTLAKATQGKISEASYENLMRLLEISEQSARDKMNAAISREAELLSRREGIPIEDARYYLDENYKKVSQENDPRIEKFMKRNNIKDKKKAVEILRKAGKL